MLRKRFINGSDFAGMVLLGAEYLQANAEQVNALNVFPVPDGDTGTNMNLTMDSGVRELKSKPSPAIGKAAEALSKGLLMGARGNSGVILSQLFRGVAKSLSGLEQADSVQLAAALQHGVDTAYKAVVKPVEGTILTVAKEAARHAVQIARRTDDAAELMREVHRKAHETLQRTPEMLPVLKQVGVVDSGGQGLVYIYEGFWRSLAGEGAADTALIAQPGVAIAPRKPERTSAQSRLETEHIEYLYDMEFFINRKLGGSGAPPFDEAAFRQALGRDGDSIIVIADDDIIKVHVHSRRPGDVLNYALPYGELTDLRILNMREQHRDLLHREDEALSSGADDDPGSVTGLASVEVLAGPTGAGTPPEQVHEWAPFGIIAVALGEGVAEIFRSSNVDIVLSGGQTMNPSTEDFLKAIESLPAEHIFLLPNNGNIVLAAEQAAELSDRQVTVIPTRTIPQGLAAAFAFKEEEDAERNAEWMKAAAEQVRSGQVTHAVRDTTIDGVHIREGDYIGISEKTIVVSSGDLQETCRQLLNHMLEGGGELLTVLTGADADPDQTAALSDWIASSWPDVELEIHEGGQPLYPYLFAVE